MFTGIITDIGTVRAIEGGQFEIACQYDPLSISLGASIACDGCCLTVTKIETNDAEGCSFSVDVSTETLEVTTLSDWRVGDQINLERALKMGDELGGHMVSGHVDGVCVIEALTVVGNSTRYLIQCPDDLKQFIAPKGSVTLGGVSLTVNQVEDKIFSVNIIPHTLSQTVWQNVILGTKLNLEVDLLARYALRARQVREEKKS